MKLLKLRSDNELFKTISFESGLTIVAGLQKSKDKNKSYNGVGKSSTLNLIHWMLGARLNNKTEREKKVNKFLKAYGNFYLEIRHDGADYVITKNFAHNEFYVNDQKYSNKDYNQFLTELFVKDLPSSISFRNILNCFARRYGDKYYSEAHGQQGRPDSDYQQRLVNLALLGLDTSIVERKQKTKQAIEKLKKSQSAISEVVSQDDIHVLKDLKDQLASLTSLREELEIASAYDHEKEAADELTYHINELRDSLYESRKNLKRKNSLLSQIGDIEVDVSQLKTVYEEALIFFKEQVVVELEEACQFHKKLISNRTNRLTKEIGLLTEEIRRLKESLEPLETKRDLILRNMSADGAFDEYESVSQQILIKTGEISQIESNLQLAKKIESELSAEKLKNAEIHNEALGYLNSISEYLEKLDDDFRRIVKSFYNNNTGSVIVQLSKDAQYLYDLDIHVPKDSSQGVNEVRIFCYDMLLYERNRELLGFVAHDGCIFSELDPRQKAQMFKVALEYVNDTGLQYFVNIGQSSLEEILKSEVLTNSEKEQIRNAIVLNLLDEAPETWLFGSQFG
ncbi:TPA: DUF2326 domain-containing protein [Vibrio harveyi]|nr:DUF2326 domain-containing protein [Vibrio harveyi]